MPRNQIFESMTVTSITRMCGPQFIGKELARTDPKHAIIEVHTATLSRTRPVVFSTYPLD